MRYYLPRLLFVAVALPVWFVFGFWGSVTLFLFLLLVVETIAFFRRRDAT